MALIGQMVKKLMHGSAVAGGAFVTGAATTKLGGESGYSIGGYVPLSLAAGVGFYAGSILLKGAIGADLASLIASMGDGALATWAGGVGRSAGLGQISLLGTGEDAAFSNVMKLQDQLHKGQRAG